MNKFNEDKYLHEHLNEVAVKFLRQMIRAEYPEWVDYNGECKKCDEYYDSLLDAVEIR